MIEHTAEYKRGRNGEILMHSFAIEYGCTTFDIGGTAQGRAPLLGAREGNIIAPDALHIRNHPVWAEYKTKTSTFDWGGGSRNMLDRMPPCLAHGIPRHSFVAYRDANERMPLTLWFLTINTGMLHVASLDELGEPFPSADPQKFDIVNWPISRMHRVASFHKKRLQAYFGRDRRHAGLPNEIERKQLLDFLRPVQLEFDFIEHFLSECEHHWASRGSAA